MKRRVAEMEEEAAKLRELQANLDQQQTDLAESKEDVDSRSIFVGNVDSFGITRGDPGALPKSCGSINRVTILLDKFTGTPKGYVEISPASFRSSPHTRLHQTRADQDAWQIATPMLNFSEPSPPAWHKRLCSMKAYSRDGISRSPQSGQTFPGMSRGRGVAEGRGGGRGFPGGGRGGFAPRGGYRGGYRGRGRGGYAPY